MKDEQDARRSLLIRRCWSVADDGRAVRDYQAVGHRALVPAVSARTLTRSASEGDPSALAG
jgi:hypothetical protein